MADMKNVGLGIIVLILIIIAVIGFFEYNSINSNYMSLSSSYSSLSASYSNISSSYNALQSNYTKIKAQVNLEPMFVENGIETVTINSSSKLPYLLKVGSIEVTVKPGTMAEFNNGTLMKSFQFSLVTFSLKNVNSPEKGLTPTYAFAFMVNGKITPEITLVHNVSGKLVPYAPITIVSASDNTTSWTWLGGKLYSNGTYIGGKYAFADKWLYGNNTIVNTLFVKPVIWIFETQSESALSPKQISLQQSQVFGLTPITSYTYMVNGTEGAVINAGNILVVIQPDTMIDTGKANLTTFNFSVVFYPVYNVSTPGGGYVPFEVFAFAINGNVTFDYTSLNQMSGKPQPFLTIMNVPTSSPVEMLTWGGTSGNYQYVLHDPIFVYDGTLVNYSFVKPVPWVVAIE
ncbi:hypothetical protein [Sulfuracidifex metallicus]|uniref:Uncharacterized protein n=2 Tax=Sulfuracidifex metallicus TaxID=47303 RepID=A0A6A9QT79_SULME|nr:hypothetical protein [Sulfuracidifex metallicus]MUN28352.1 hypothetical protein [Sulfuracidifex metallicus DSM 6482 = JCM 9184]WOE51124.1 hypothetical protein RQ359_000373 [Sulfuracidifex metallicus DSM 6482 = JCM 9184]